VGCCNWMISTVERLPQWIAIVKWRSDSMGHDLSGSGRKINHVVTRHVQSHRFKAQMLRDAITV